MISRRDKLLKNPWEQRKYENHLRKVNNAVPVIDNKPPVSRQHVSVKLKKRQIELERIRQIENDNLILLRRINYVMNTNRVDNWNVPPQQTKYLNRVPLCSISGRPSTTSTINSIQSSNSSTMQNATAIDINQNHLRKSKCLACSPQIHATESPEIVSARIPWEEPKMYSKTMGEENTRQRSKSLPVIKTAKDNSSLVHPSKITFKLSAKDTPNGGKSKSCRHTPIPSNDNFVKLQKQISLNDSKTDNTQKILISSGSLKLCVKFPTDSQIMLKNGGKEKIVFGNQHLPSVK